MYLNNEIRVLIITFSPTCFDACCSIFRDKFIMLKTIVIFCDSIGSQVIV